MIVYKYGGTALLDEEQLIATVNEGIAKHQKIILIVSAIGRYPSPYSTDTFFKMCDCVSEIEKARIVSCGEIISSVKASNILNKNYIKSIAVSIYDINLIYDDGFQVDSKIYEYL